MMVGSSDAAMYLSNAIQKRAFEALERHATSLAYSVDRIYFREGPLALPKRPAFARLPPPFNRTRELGERFGQVAHWHRISHSPTLMGSFIFKVDIIDRHDVTSLATV
jgi:hypothetical protein